jgi:UDP-N-acetylmuramoyl-L-alanyl-D-glutamate--2,6-diaminopimelate ligase
MTKILGELLEGLEIERIVGSRERHVTGLITDSRKVERESLFACMRGGRSDGHDFARAAAARGASVLLCESLVKDPGDATQVVVGDVRRALAHIASLFYDDPSADLQVVGVTGTNGKTTTVHLIRAILEEWDRQVGVMGTLGHRIGDEVIRGPFTTPESPQVQEYMRKMVDGGMEFCVMEVSSHALSLSRVDHVDFDVVVFTNLTRDHLDFHGTRDEYKAAKMMLFGIGDRGHSLGANRRAVVNAGDATGREIAARTPLEATTYGLAHEADCIGQVERLDETGAELTVTADGTTTRLRTRLRGRMNAENVLAAFATARLIGVPADVISQAIADFETPPGRMEFLRRAGRLAVVDYAHTPDALGRLLVDLREICRGRLICVFGCGGDRDAGKRPEMGEIAGRLADVVVVTTDNPRTEDPMKIIEAIVAGLGRGADRYVVPDRAEAVRWAVAMSAPGDVIVVAGKGHEDYQIIGEKRIHFDDREILDRALGAIEDAQTKP